MKKFIFLAIVSTLVSGCFSDDDKACSPESDETPVEIKVHAGVYDIKTRAPVNAGQSITAKFVASTTAGDYSSNLWSATGTFTAAINASTTFSFTPAQYYPTNNSKVYIKGYYPPGTLSGKTVTFAETDGSNDVMITSEANGNKATVGALGFTFKHLLTQLQFTFKAGPGFPESGKSVTSISIKNQQTPLSLNLNDSTVTYNDASVITLTGSYPISADPGTTATVYPMVKSGATTVVLGIKADGVTYNDVTVTLAATEVGKAHNITLTFTPKEITATAIVTAWITGGTGSSTIQ